MKKAWAFTLLLAAFVLSFPLISLGIASDSVTATVTFHVPVMQSLTIQGSSTAGSAGNLQASSDKSVTTTFNIPEPTDKQLNKGFVKKEDAIEITAKSNVNWELQVEASSQYMGTSDNGKYRKPVSDLEVRAQENPFREVDTSPTTIANGRDGTHDLGIDYKVNFDQKEYQEGDYVTKLTYTMTTRD